MDNQNTASRIEKLEREIEKIRERNKKVELNKAWETSTARHVIIAVLTYAATYIVFLLINIQNPHFNAIIPTVAFFLSMQSLPMIKKWWIKKHS